MATRYDMGALVRLIVSTARRNGIDDVTAVAQFIQEGSMDYCRTSSAGAKGPAQFMPATAKTYGVSDRCDMAETVAGWSRYMSKLLRQFNGRIDIALAGYNSGENRSEYRNAAAYGRAINWSVLPPGVQTETQTYVRNILGFRQAEARKLIEQYASDMSSSPATGPVIALGAGALVFTCLWLFAGGRA